MQAFHAAGWAERAEIAEIIEDDRYRELARRLVFVNAPGVLPESRHTKLHTWLEHRRLGREGVEAGRTLYDAVKELDETSSPEPGLQNAISAIRSWFNLA